MPSSEGPDAIAVWQHQGDTWDIYYSLWDQDTLSWQVPDGSKSAPIAVDAGDDHDPDVSSNERFAVAVWQKESNGIYYSLWQNSAWTSPKTISSGSMLTDPTVAVDGKGNALAVWVSSSKELYSSYYSSSAGWTTPEKLDTTGISKLSLPELAYGSAGYYLVFTGKDSASTNAYAASYSSAGWTAPVQVGSDALLDNSVPTDQRTGISVADTKAEVTLVWPGSDNQLYSVKLGSSAKHFADGKMPDVSYDSGEIANGAYTDDEDLFHQPNVNSPTSEPTISSLKESDDRSSLTFIKDRSIGLVLWWTKVSPPGQIYYSYYDAGSWKGVDVVDPAIGGVLNRNPAVSPLRELSEGEEQPYCGDAVINLPFEQCEVGIPCPNPADFCNLANCQCIPDYPPTNESIDCSTNTMAGLVGLSLWAPGMMCKDDCAAVYGKQYTCDATCNCVKKPKPQALSCAGNSGLFGPVQPLAAGQICTDDCDVLGAEYECEPKSCSCRKKQVPPKPKNVSCADNSWTTAFGGQSKFKAGDICQDDCKNLPFGESLVCNPEACVCEEKQVETRYCAGHTQEVARTDKNTFDASSMKCEDNCEQLGEGYECNVDSCTCTKPYKENVACSGNTINNMNPFAASNNTFDPATQICTDDCKEYFDMSEVYCNAKTCLCELATTCAGNTEDTVYYGSNAFSGGQCIDNCENLGKGYKCDVESCLCRKAPGEDVYCAANTDDAYVTDATGAPLNPFDPSTQQCLDNCKEIYGERAVCDAKTCYCVPSEDITELSCTANTDHVSVTDVNNFNPAATQCLDDCAEYMGSEYECNAQSCTCTKKPKTEVSCMNNALDIAFILNGSKSYDPKTQMCKDDCEEYAKALGIGLVCNAESCKCEPSLTCAGNTLDGIQYGENGFIPDLYRCEDNCEKLGEGYVCDMKECFCRPEPGEKIYCAANTDEAYLDDSLGKTHERFDSTARQCVDNCREIYGESAECDMKTCYCVPKSDIKELSCSGNTDSVIATDVNNFDPSKSKCVDDCAEYAGSEYTCNAQSCTCVKDSRPTCSSNTIVGNVGDLNVSYGTDCRDDCAEVYGDGYNCDPVLCYCKSNKTITPRCGDGYVSTEFVPGGGSEECDPAATPTGCYGSMVCNAECQCESKDIVVECGDGKITGAEACDWGSTDTNKCDAGYYCSACDCVPLETTAVCGDGKISVEIGEECDGGSVYYNKCPSGQQCSICKCVGETTQCGDGKVIAPEECDHGNSYTESCPSGKVCYSCACVDPEDVVEDPFCGNDEVEAGEECDGTDDSACPSGQYCNSYCECEQESQDLYCGDGIVSPPEQCEEDDDCDGDAHCSGCACVTTTYLYCGDGIINLNEQCEDDHDCGSGESCISCQCLAPPEVDCSSWCSGQGYGESLGGSYGSSSACGAAAAEDVEECTVKCVYSKYGSWSNPAGTTSCCCKDVYVESCPMFGSGCICPSESEVENVICPANQP